MEKADFLSEVIELKTALSVNTESDRDTKKINFEEEVDLDSEIGEREILQVDNTRFSKFSFLEGKNISNFTDF